MATQTLSVFDRLDWMEQQGIWPNGRRFLWSDAFGVVLLVSLYHEFDDDHLLDRAEQLVADVDRTLGGGQGLLIGDDSNCHGQYYHYLAMWLYALYRLGEVEPAYWKKAVDLVREIHPRFVMPEVGVLWKMKEDLSGPFPGYGLGGLDAFHGYVIYSLLAPDELHEEIGQMKRLVERSYRTLHIEQDLGIGMMLWLTHFCPREPWAVYQRHACLDALSETWVDPPGYYCRYPGALEVKCAFTNYGVSLGLQSVDELPEHVDRINDFFDAYGRGDEFSTHPVTHVMACTSRFPGEFIRSTNGR